MIVILQQQGLKSTNQVSTGRIPSQVNIFGSNVADVEVELLNDELIGCEAVK